MRDVFICDAVRTPIGRFGGSLAKVRADDLAAVPLKALLARPQSVEWAAVDDVLLGCANQAGEGRFSTLSAPRHALAACAPLGTCAKPSIDLPRAPS